MTTKLIRIWMLRTSHRFLLALIHLVLIQYHWTWTVKVLKGPWFWRNSLWMDPLIWSVLQANWLLMILICGSRRNRLLSQTLLLFRFTPSLVWVKMWKYIIVGIAGEGRCASCEFKQVWFTDQCLLDLCNLSFSLGSLLKKRWVCIQPTNNLYRDDREGSDDIVIRGGINTMILWWIWHSVANDCFYPQQVLFGNK